MKAGGTRAVSQTPFAAQRNSWPAARIPAASTRRTTGRPRRAPTAVAVARSADRCTWVRLPGWRPSARMPGRNLATVPGNTTAGGTALASPRATGTGSPPVAPRGTKARAGRVEERVPAVGPGGRRPGHARVEHRRLKSPPVRAGRRGHDQAKPGEVGEGYAVTARELVAVVHH